MSRCAVVVRGSVLIGCVFFLLWTGAGAYDAVSGDDPVGVTDAPALQTLRFQGFEGTTNDTWAFETFPGQGRVAVRGELFYSLGQTDDYSLRLTGSDASVEDPSNPYVVFDRVDLSGHTGVTFSIAFACWGPDLFDDLWVDLSYDDGASWPDATRLVRGYSNTNILFGETSERTVEANPYVFAIDDAHDTLRVRVRFQEAPGANNLYDHYHVDDLLVQGYGHQPLVYFGTTEMVTSEGDMGVALPVHISEPADATVRVAVAGTALPGGVDFSLSTTTVVFSAAGPTTQNLMVDVMEDAEPEGPEWARLTLVRPEGARIGGPDRAKLFIRDHDSVAIMAANLPAGPDLDYVEEANRQFRLLRPDVVAIQEWLLPEGSTDYRAYVDEHFGPEFDFYIEGYTGLPNGVISRWTIDAAGTWEQPDMPDRDFVWASIGLPGGAMLHVVSVHFKAGSDSSDRNRRIAEARALTNHIAQAGFAPEDFLVIAGDLNLGGRNEETIQILESIVSDEHKPADQFGEQRTSANRNHHYDFVLPNAPLEDRHLAYEFNGFVFPHGMVFDSRVWDAHMLPVRVDDCGVENMQHMAVMKVFELESIVSQPASFSAEAVSEMRIDLAWEPNEDGHEVVIVYSGEGLFTPPEGVPPSAGEPFAGGTVVYRGTGSPQSHTGLSACMEYYYRCWSYDGTNFSAGRTAKASTLPPPVPTGLNAADEGPAQFTALWNEVATAEGYYLQVATDVHFTGDDELQTLVRETMGEVASTTSIAAHQDNGGFDNPGLTMSGGGASSPGDVRATDPSEGYQDPAGSPASGEANIWLTNAEGERGFGMAGMDTRNHADLALSFGYRKTSPEANATFAVEWSTHADPAWKSLDLSALPDAGGSVGWYMLGPVNLPADAAGVDDLRLRWVKTGTVGLRLDDVLLQGKRTDPSLLPGYTNLFVSGSSQVVTGLTQGVTYHFRVRSKGGGCLGDWSEVKTITLGADCFESAPVALGAEETSPTQFLARWTTLPDAVNYRLDVSTHETFEPDTGGTGGIETFDNMGSPSSAYLTRIWTNNSIVWTAYKARTDQTIDGPAVCLSWDEGAYLVSSTIPGGVDELSIEHQQQFTGSDGTFDLFVNGTRVAEAVDISTSVQTTRVTGLAITGDFSLMITNCGSVRVAFDNLAWTNTGSASFVPGYEHRFVEGGSEMVTGLTAETWYYYRVRAEGEYGCMSDYSNTQAVETVYSAPGAPTGLTASLATATEHIELEWHAVPGSMGYVIRRHGEDAFEEASAIGTNPPGQIFFFDTSALPGVPYHYWVVATNAEGPGPPSDPAVGRRRLTAPTGLHANPTNETHFTAHWNSVEGAVNYRLDVSTHEAFEPDTGGTGGIETFDNMGSSNTAYLTRIWTNNSIVWTAYKARTDRTIDGPAICLNREEGAYLVSSTIPGGVDELSIEHQQQFTGSDGTFDLFVNGTRVAEAVDISTNVQTTRVTGLAITGDFSLMITNCGSVRVAFDNLAWTNAGSGGFVPGYEHRLVEGGSEEVTGLAPGSTYYYRMRAEDDAAYSSAHSEVASVTLPAGGAPYVIMSAAGLHGSIHPAGMVEVAAGATQAFVITAAPLYHIADVATNETSIGLLFDQSSSSHTFVWSNVMAHGSIEASFAPMRTTLAPFNVPLHWLEEHFPGTNDYEAAALSDTDGDGLAAWQEYVAGTNPNDPDSVLTTEAHVAPDGSHIIIWQGTSLPNRLYDICLLTSVNGPVDVLASNIPSAYPALNVHTNTGVEDLDRLYYRVRVTLDDE